MKNKRKHTWILSLLALILALAVTACSTHSDPSSSQSSAQDGTNGSASSNSTGGSMSTSQTTSDSFDSALDVSTLFTERDLTQTADLSNATYYTVSDGEDITITEAGVYVISGTASNVTILVEAGDEDKVQIVLDGVEITNESRPCIYVKTADKVFVTTTDSENTLTVSGTFTKDGNNKTDAVIFSKQDLVLNGTGILTISSTDNGIVSKDDLKVTGGTIILSAADSAFKANDLIAIADGVITIETSTDGLHSENNDDASLGNVYIGGGTLTINASDDAIHAITIFQIDGGSITVNAPEGLEGTWIQINGGSLNITATDDGINAANKSSAYTARLEINGGDITIDMGVGDTDAIDSNGDLYINGGTITITAQNPFDYDGTCEFNGGTVYVNGQQVTTITTQDIGGMGGGRR